MGLNVTNGPPPGTLRSKPINTARGTPWVWRTCGTIGFDKPRYREVSRSVGPRGPLASRAPSVFRGQAVYPPKPVRAKAGRRQETAHPGPQRIGAMTLGCL